MTYPYGMKGAPAVGGGLGGLPVRSTGAGINDWRPKVKNRWVLGATGTISFGKDVDPRLIMLSAIGFNQLNTTSPPRDKIVKVVDFIPCSIGNAFFTNGPSSVGFQIYTGQSSVQLLSVDAGAILSSLEVVELDEKIRSHQTVRLNAVTSMAEISLGLPIANPGKTFYSYKAPGNTSSGVTSVCGRVVSFGSHLKDVCIPWAVSSANPIPFSFIDAGTIRVHPVLTAYGSMDLDIVEFE